MNPDNRTKEERMADSHEAEFQYQAMLLLRFPERAEEIYRKVKTEFPDRAEEFVWVVLQAGLTNYLDERQGRWVSGEPVKCKGQLLFGKEAEDFEKDLLYGWFVRGDVNIVHGFSGSGKSRLLLEIEDALRSGREFLGCKRKLNGKPLFIGLDRDVRAIKTTLRDMGLPEDFVDVAEPAEGKPFKEGKTFRADRLQLILQDYLYPELVVLEGLDILIGNVNDGDMVSMVLGALQKVGRESGCCLVGTVGSPKRQSTKDRYSNSRHAIIGHQAWSRMTRTTVGVEMEMAGTTTNRKETGFRIINVDTRGKPLKYKVGFTDEGRMFESRGLNVEIDQSGTENMGYKEALEAAVKHLQDLTGMSKATYYRKKNEEK